TITVSENRRIGDELTRRTAPHGDSFVPFGRVLLSAGKPRHPDVRRIPFDPAPPARRIELRDPPGHRRTATAPDTSVPAESPAGAGRSGPARVDRTQPPPPHPLPA